MADKTIKKRVDEMQTGDILLKNRMIEHHDGTFSFDLKDKVKYEVIEPYTDNKMVIKNLETEEIKVLHNFGWLEYDVLVPKKKKGK